ncbi:L-2-amino-thiazoline-4-carboxylic acid hydrolase [Anaerovirgula multivorans]|uniref:L-2-amino-thiazoline-4-carboxylic acid hydrolase n=1 Tax=Anaerovirgula multivorans TaxID=312168 RepID=A0A239G3R2_9FIRM|nr:L-2-amino-thiazoline-4-carboxylic acid hydrolase [Anaerovirgula multivorans]SNS63819.1 L-2-amino-thiazoline-4-carboxylic acid hydrolase [Anaerovirgula multivorans]
MSEKKYTQEELTKAFRSAIADRAKWFYLLEKYTDEGFDKIAERAITEFGIDKGKSLGDCKTAKDFANGILTGHAREAFAMEPIKVEEEESVIKFHHCALVEEWKKLGCSSEEVAHLCDLACFGDFGMVSVFPELELEFKQLLSRDEECCEMVITKK